MVVLNTTVLLAAFVVLDDRTWSDTDLGKILGHWLPYAVGITLLAVVANYFIMERYGLKDKS